MNSLRVPYLFAAAALLTVPAGARPVARSHAQVSAGVTKGLGDRPLLDQQSGLAGGSTLLDKAASSSPFGSGTGQAGAHGHRGSGHIEPGLKAQSGNAVQRRR